MTNQNEQGKKLKSWFDFIPILLQGGTLAAVTWGATLIYSLGANGEIFKTTVKKVADHDVKISEVEKSQKEDYERMRTITENLILSTQNLSGNDRVIESELRNIDRRINELHSEKIRGEK